MNLLELQERDPLKMTLEELEQHAMQLLTEMEQILDNAHSRIRREKNATADRK